jgi:hypothetical protein
MSTIQELGAFLSREQAAGTTLTPTSTSTTPGTSTSPASPTATSTGPAVERPATDAAFNTDHNGASPAHLR